MKYYAWDTAFHSPSNFGKKQTNSPPKKNQEHPHVLTTLKSYLFHPLEIFIKYKPNDEKFYVSCNNL